MGNITRVQNGGNLIPTQYALYQNYPNPFNPSTTIKYDLPKETRVKLEIYDILGQRIKTLINNEQQTAGFYQLQWNGKNDFGVPVATGVYFYRIKADNFIKTKKMILLK